MKWEVIQGKNPSKREMAVWDEGHWITFLRFCEQFIVTDAKETKDGSGYAIKVTEESWLKSEEILKMPDHPFQEFLYRIDRFTSDEKATRVRFTWKLVTVMKIVLGYLRANPSIITTKMREIIEPNPRFNWCLKQTKIVKTAVGEIVVPDRVQRVDSPQVGQRDGLAPYEQNLAEAVLKVTNLLTNLIDSIKPEELEKLPMKDKLMAVGRMAYVFSVGKHFKVNARIFQNININTAGRDELEKMMLDYNRNN